MIMQGGYYVTARDDRNRVSLLVGPFKTQGEADALGFAVQNYIANGAHGRDWGPVTDFEWGIGFFAFRSLVPGGLNEPLKVWVTGGDVSITSD